MPAAKRSECPESRELWRCQRGSGARSRWEMSAEIGRRYLIGATNSGGAVQTVTVSATGDLGLRRRARTAGSGDILELDKWRVVSPTRAVVIDDGGHVRRSELRAERGHRR